VIRYLDEHRARFGGVQPICGVLRLQQATTLLTGLIRSRCERNACRMDWFRAATDLAGKLVWPAVVLTLAIVFRHSLGSLVGRLRTLEAPGVKGTFGDQIAQVEDLAADATDAALGVRPSDETDRTRDEEVTPAVIVLGAWAQLRGTVERAVAHDSADGPAPLMRDMFESARLPAEAVVAVDRLGELRARVGRGDQVSRVEANAFARAAREMALLWEAKADLEPAFVKVRRLWSDFLDSVSTAWDSSLPGEKQPGHVVLKAMRRHGMLSRQEQQTLDALQALAEGSSEIGIDQEAWFAAELEKARQQIEFTIVVTRDGIMSEGDSPSWEALTLDPEIDS
jgi:hypothetical protein